MNAQSVRQLEWFGDQLRGDFVVFLMLYCKYFVTKFTSITDNDEDC